MFFLCRGLLDFDDAHRAAVSGFLRGIFLFRRRLMIDLRYIFIVHPEDLRTYTGTQPAAVSYTHLDVYKRQEVDYAVEVCNAVLDVWKPDAEHKAIINLPTTVQVAMPHVFACQVEYMNKRCV